MIAAILKSAILDSAILHKNIFTCSFWLNLMMAAILISAMLDSDTAILDSDTLLSSLRLTQKHSPSTLTLTQTNWIWLAELDDGNHLEFCHLGFSHLHKKNFTHSISLKLMIAAILNSAILDSAMLHKTLAQTISIWHKLIHSHSTWWWQPISNSSILNSAILNSAIMDSAILQKKCFTHSFWLNLMMAAILNSAMLVSDTAILDSNTLLSSLRWTQKHSPSTLTLTQTNWFWLTRWWQPSWILPSWIQPFEQKKLHSFILTQIDDCRKSWILLSWIQPFCTKKTSLVHSDINLMMAAILNSAMLDWDTAILDSNTCLSSLRLTQKHTSYTFWLWLKLIPSD